VLLTCLLFTNSPTSLSHLMVAAWYFYFRLLVLCHVVEKFYLKMSRVYNNSSAFSSCATLVVVAMWVFNYLLLFWSYRHKFSSFLGNVVLLQYIFLNLICNAEHLYSFGMKILFYVLLSYFVKLNLSLVKKCFSYFACLIFHPIEEQVFVAIHLDVVTGQ